ncbi:MAG TPA: glycoside hydrolase family 43 protein [Pyrinomonadaceae bacterium]|jgi:GH43 family beta-xylosidase
MSAKILNTRFITVVLFLAFLVSSCPAALAQSATFTNPIVKSRDAADPWMVYRDGYYYFTFTAGNRIEVWKSPTITGIEQGTKVTVWQAPSFGPQCCNIWAPELHFIGGKWYIYYAADDSNDAHHRMYVLESTGTDPQGAYLDKGKISALTDRWAIDGSVLQKPDGSLYFIWSGWANLNPGPQNIYIAPMSNPWTISGERTLISAPVNPWENVGWAVNEGPVALQRGGKVFIVYSASGGSTADYCLGMLTNTDGNLLAPGSWQKSQGCVFAKTDTVYGPGHNSFVKSPDQTEDWIIYHARDTPFQTWEGRTARAQKFTWLADGTPRFGVPSATNISLPTPSGEVKQTPAPAPVLLTEEGSGRAAALDSVTWMREPFLLLTSHNFSLDQRARFMLFARNVELQPGESASVITAEGEDSAHRIFPLSIEYVGKVSGLDWLTQIIIKLPDGMNSAGEMQVSIKMRGTPSNKVLISVSPSPSTSP